jgi:hypothetical protein
MKPVFFIFLFLLFGGYLYAQESDSISSGWGELNYAIPNMPAFSLLSQKPDNMITPASVRKLIVDVADFKNFGIEIAPLLFDPNISLPDFRKHSFWYRMRLSVGTTTLDNGTLQVAEGLRFTIIDKTDLRGDTAFAQELAGFLFKKHTLIESIIEQYANEHNQSEDDVLELYVSDTIFRHKIDSMLVARSYDMNEMDHYREKIKQERWNATIWETGLATMQESSNENLKNMQVKKMALWTTFGTHFGKNSTLFGKRNQLLIGGKVEMIDSLAQWHSKLSVGARFYYGTNELRAFAQGQYENINPASIHTQTFLSSLGLVFKVYEGIWVQCAANVLFDFKGNALFEPRINIGFGSIWQRKMK